MEKRIEHNITQGMLQQINKTKSSPSLDFDLLFLALVSPWGADILCFFNDFPLLDSLVSSI
jgi:hypothetical protein